MLKYDNHKEVESFLADTYHSLAWSGDSTPQADARELRVAQEYVDGKVEERDRSATPQDCERSHVWINYRNRAHCEFRRKAIVSSFGHGKMETLKNYCFLG